MMETAAYQPVTREIVKELQAVVGEKSVIFGDAELLRNYSGDEVAGSDSRSSRGSSFASAGPSAASTASARSAPPICPSS